MKKIFFFLIIMGVILFCMPEFVIFEEITTQLVGSALLTVAAVWALLLGLWKFQIFCDYEITRMHEQRERELAEQNIQIVYPTLDDLAKVAKQWLKLLGYFVIGVFVFIGAWVFASWIWTTYPGVIKAVACTVGILLAILLVCCAFAPSREKTEQMEATGSC